MEDGRQWHLLPGTLCTSAVFDQVLTILEVPHENRHNVEISKPKIDDYRQYFETAIAQDDIICGFSLGAIVAAHHADILPKDATLLLFGINPMPDDPAKADGRAALCADVNALGGRVALEKRLEAARPRMSAESFELILTMANDTAPFIEAQTQLALSRPGALPALANAQCAVNALAGQSDDQVPLDLAKKAADAAPDGRLYSLPNLMHYAILEDPIICTNAVRHALQRGQLSEESSCV